MSSSFVLFFHSLFYMYVSWYQKFNLGSENVYDDLPPLLVSLLKMLRFRMSFRVIKTLIHKNVSTNNKIIEFQIHVLVEQAVILL